METESEIIAEAATARDCDKSLRCMNNCEDTEFDAETLLDQATDVLGMAEEVNVDLIECTDTEDLKLVKDEDPDATECSSSFGETVSSTEDGSRLSEAEVESRFCGDDGIGSNVFDGLDGLFRMEKKKLTPHWRRYIRPLMWRCKWIELRMKELRCQALKYDKELAATGQRKHFESAKYSSEYGVKSVPFPGVCHREKVMKRRKRKRTEETIDIPSYMSQHNLFSYYENRRSDPDAASMDDDCGIQVIEADDNNIDEFDFNDGCSSLQFRDNDALEQFLWRIEKMQSRVQKLRIQMDKLLTVNAIKFSSMENLSLLAQSDQPSSSTPSLTLSPHNGEMRPVGSLYTPPRNIPEYDMRDMVVMEGAVSSYEEVSPPDIIGSTMGLLSAAEVSSDQQQNGDSCENIVDDVLIHNQAAVIGSLLIEKPQESVKEKQDKVMAPTSASASEHGPTRENTRSEEHSLLKSCLTSEFRVPKNKRKRGERKAGAGGWKPDKISMK